MGLPIRYAHIPFYFCFSFTSSTSLIHHYTLQPHVITLTLARHSHSLHLTNLTYLMDTCFTIHMFLLLFLVSPTCALLQSHTPCGQALSIALLWMSLMLSLLLLFIFNLPVFTFRYTQAPTNCLYEFPPELRFSTYVSHCLALILHCFALHCTASQSHCLYPPPHLEMIPCPQITPPQSLIGFILRSLAP